MPRTAALSPMQENLADIAADLVKISSFLRVHAPEHLTEDSPWHTVDARIADTLKAVAELSQHLETPPLNSATLSGVLADFENSVQTARQLLQTSIATGQQPTYRIELKM